jgi:hypothetical protein
LVSGLLITPHYTKVGAFFILSIDYATTVSPKGAAVIHARRGPLTACVHQGPRDQS